MYLPRGVILPRTGEGKTPTATLLLISKRSATAFVINVNDYLVSTQTGAAACRWGATVFIPGPVRNKRDAYQADVTYGTNNEFGFDYL